MQAQRRNLQSLTSRDLWRLSKDGIASSGSSFICLKLSCLVQVDLGILGIALCMELASCGH